VFTQREDKERTVDSVMNQNTKRECLDIKIIIKDGARLNLDKRSRNYRRGKKNLV
jgi:hypothetical protein